MIEPLVADLKDSANDNEFFRRVLFTGTRSQLVLMSLVPGEEIGAEEHEVYQLIFVAKGEGKVVLNGVESPFGDGMVACVPAGVHHNVINTDDKPMKLFTVYAPPEHAAATVHKTKADAESAEKAAHEPAIT